MLRIAVDFDGTITLKDSYPNLGEPNMLAINCLKKYHSLSGKIILHTCREGRPLNEAIEFCRKYGLIFDAVNKDTQENLNAWLLNHPDEPISNKPFADMYIDDRNYPCNTLNWLEIQKELLKGVDI